MSYTAETSELPGLEFDLLEYLIPVFTHWKLILLSAMFASVVTWFVASDAEKLYEAFATVTVADAQEIGGVSPDERRAPEVITLVEHGFVMGSIRNNQLQTTLARLQSRAFTTYFIQQYSVQQAFHPEKWNVSQQRWTTGSAPSIGEDRKRFVEMVRSIEHNPDNDVIRIAMRWHDPVMARNWANEYVAAFNQYSRDRALAEVDRRMQFLQSKLQSNEIVEVDKSIYRLMEAQTAIAMLAKSREEYVIEALDPAILPFSQFNMSAKKKTVIAGMATTLLTCFLIMARVLQLKICAELKRFANRSSNDKRPTF
ncbi:MAG: chain-length determining protein [Pseudomonadota bacterium]